MLETAKTLCMLKIQSIQPRRVYGRRYKPLGTFRTAALQKLPEVAVDLGAATAGDTAPETLFSISVSKTVHLEIGFGTGEHLAALASAHPDHLFLGAETYVAGISYLLKMIQEQNLSNIRIYPDDGLALLQALKTASVDHAYLLFPDPWPKLHHHKRRFIQDETLAEFARVIRPGGTLLLASDDAPLVAWMRRHTHNNADFTAAPDYMYRPQTPYAIKALAAGKNLFYLPFLRR